MKTTFNLFFSKYFVVADSKSSKSGYTEMEIQEIKKNREESQRHMSFTNSLYFAFAGLLWQSPESVPRAPSSRIPSSLWLMIGVVTVTSYTANLVALVSYKKYLLLNFSLVS